MLELLSDNISPLPEGVDETCYVVTFCVNTLAIQFGSIYRGRMIANDLGEMAATEWRSLTLPWENAGWTGDFIAMPDHLHGLFGVAGSPVSSEPAWVEAYRLVRRYRIRLERRFQELNRNLQHQSRIWEGPAIIDPVTNGWELLRWQRQIGENAQRWWLDPLRGI